MARFADGVGFAVSTVEKRPGVWEDVIIERQYFGDVVRAARQVVSADKVNSDLTVNNEIEVVADSYFTDNILAIRYVRWLGVRWIASVSEIRYPRVILTLGGKYNGPEPSTDPS